jgi:predicted P-loop ATPase
LDDFVRVNKAALDSIETLLGAWLPNGVRSGVEFCVGSRHGEAGQSLRVRLTGDKAGVWSDFSSDGEAGGDLISLYGFIHGLSPGRACAALAEQLGTELTKSDRSAPIPRQPAHPMPKAASGRAPAQAGEGGKAAAADMLLPKTPINPAHAQAGKGVEAPANKKTRTPWKPMLPVPDDAGPYPKAHLMRGKPEASWEYRDVDGKLLGVIYRFVRSDGKGKEVLPCVYAENPETGTRDWRWMAFPEPRPLYLRGPHRLQVPLVVVEGEKCTDSAHELLGDEVEFVSWPGGGKAVDKANWTAIRDREVILWADADSKVYKENHERSGELMPEAEQPGMNAMQKVAAILRAQGCTVYFVDIPAPGEVPDGWDVADLIQSGGTSADVLAWLSHLRVEPSEAESAVVPMAAEADATGQDDIPAWLDVPDPEDSSSASIPRGAGAGGGNGRNLRSKLIQTSNGGIKGCRENVFTVMQHDERLIGAVGLDLFSGLQIKRKPLPWASESGEWTEADDFSLGVYMSQNHSLLLAAIGDIERGVAQAARMHAFNPVTDYMDRCAAEWDGQSRVATALSTYWGCEDSEYLRLVATMFFTGMVVRGYRPGVKHDYAPVFEGGQGQGKSTALKVLAGDWFADTPFRMGEKDGFLAIQGVLLYEIAELEQFNRSEVTAVKAFMSSTVDRYREPYGRRMKNVPRRCAFSATTNEGEYFKDTTGNRRFWPVVTGRIDIAALERDRDQLFGEAVALWKAGVKWWPTPEQQRRLIDSQQEDREIPDVWHGRIYEYLQGLDSDGKPVIAGKINRVTARELLVKCLHYEMSKLGPARNETMRISAIMRKLGWIKDRETGGARERFYTRPEPLPAASSQGGSDGLPN